MERLKVLLAGRNESIKDDFFGELSSDFECQTTSSRIEDIHSHLQTFRPNFFLYCMYDEKKEVRMGIVSIRNEMDRIGCAFAVYGTNEELGAVTSELGGKPDVSIGMGISVSGIKTELQKYYRLKLIGADTQNNNIGTMVENAKKHILVIDDDPMMLKLVKEHLHELYQVATAINGRTANKFLETKTTDLILLDYEMPGENGPQVLHQLRENPRTKDVPVIFLTGVSTNDKIQEALAQKPQGYLLKPIDRDKLLATIKKFV